MMRDDTRRAGARRPMLEPALALILAFVLVACRGEGEPASNAPTPPNVLICLLDAARADHFGAYGYARDTTPNVDAFAATATRYSQAVADGSFTFGSVSALFTGLAPDRTGLLSSRQLSGDYELLAEVARHAGYRTRGYSENPFVSPAFGFDRGFDAFETTLDYAAWKRHPRAFSHSDSRPGIDAVLAFAGEPSERPFFAYVHLLRPHNPYAPPDDVAGRFGAKDAERDGSTSTLLFLNSRKRKIPPRRLDNIRALYDENLAASDAMFGRLLAGLRARGRLDDTIVVLLSDHGEAFREHGRLLHSSTPFEELVRIPLVVRVPGESAGVVDRPVQLSTLGARLADVMRGERAAADLVRMGEPEGKTVSWSMLSEGRACARTPDRKLCVETAGMGVTGYYDLSADPGERHSLPLDQAGGQLLTFLRERVRAGMTAASGSRPAPIDPEVRDRIRALGYIEE